MPSRKLTRFACLALIIVSVLAGSPAHAYHRERQAELERLMGQQRGKIAESKRQESSLLQQIDDSDKRRELLEVQLRTAEHQVAQAQVELARIDARLRTLDDLVRTKTMELETLLGDLYEQETLMRNRVAEFYMNGPSSFSMRSGVTHPRDLVDAYAYTQSVLEADQGLIQTIETSKNALSARRSEIQGVQADVADAHNKQKAETTRLANAAASVHRASDAVAAEMRTKRQLLGQVRDRRAEYERVLQSYERENARVTAFLQSSGSGSGSGGVIRGQGGYMRWPVSGQITSPYGWRTHPIYRTRRFHTGIDVGVSSGTPIGAGRSGRVLSTGYMGAYGLTVIVDHGEGIATLYAHMSAIRVSSGQSVSTGDTVGLVGSTGYSTGPHLHFEVRVNGQHTNPMQWL